jgi:hypothetical protein
MDRPVRTHAQHAAVKNADVEFAGDIPSLAPGDDDVDPVVIDPATSLGPWLHQSHWFCIVSLVGFSFSPSVSIFIHLTRCDLCVCVCA